jgi:hypothetical protein
LKSFKPLKEQIELECSGAPVVFVGGFAALPGGPVTSPPSATLTPTPEPTKADAQSAAAYLLTFIFHLLGSKNWRLSSKSWRLSSPTLQESEGVFKQRCPDGGSVAPAA